MGEYISVDEKEIKIGTCDAMDYVRYEELEEAASRCKKIDGNGIASDYLDASGIFWRFPWPWEDGTTLPNIGERDYDPRPAHGLFECPSEVEIEHENVSCHISYKGGGGGINVAIPCPFGKGPHPDTSQNVDRTQKIYPTSQRRWTDGTYTVFECAYCGVPFCMSVEELAYFQAFNRQKLNQEAAYAGEAGKDARLSLAILDRCLPNRPEYRRNVR